MKPNLLRSVFVSSLACGAALASAARLGRVRFLVVDPKTGRPAIGEVVVRSANHAAAVLPTGVFAPGETAALDMRTWAVAPALEAATTIKIPLGASLTLRQQEDGPVQEITIKVTATRLGLSRAPTGAAATERQKSEISKFVNIATGDAKALVKGQKGVAEDSAGQAHFRGEHAEISYVIDGVPLPDRLSGGQGAVVVPSTIESLEILTGGYAPEFGGDTAAILNIATLPSARRASTDAVVQGGDYHTLTGDLTSVGPMGRRGSYVVDISSTRTDIGEEPQQPDVQDAHNAGASRNYFAKLRFAASASDSLSLTLSSNPNSLQIGNRTGLPASFADVGEGFGFLGLRNADGTRPDVNGSNAGLLGAAPELLPSQQAEGMDIDQQEVDEFASLQWQRRMGSAASAQLALTLLHSGQDVTNANPSVDVLDLPVDNSIEFNPTASRNVHQAQLTGSYSLRHGPHRMKAGFLLDAQSGQESYQIVPGSQLALDELAALDPKLVPVGSAGAQVDINGNPIYTPTSGQVPTLSVRRKGAYKAAYAQDSWQISPRFVANYGLRADWFNQNQDLGQPSVESFLLSPRLNFSYQWNARMTLRASYNKLFNIPPLAQGAIVGAPIEPEILDQYDLGVDRKVGRNQTVSAAYYYKNIRNQVDTGLLIPGSEIGLFSAVNFDIGAVHGVELSYDVVASKGLDAYLNYSHSRAAPNGFDNTGAPAPDFNDHDQSDTVGAGIAYTWAGGATAAATFQYGSGLASSVVPPSADRTPRSETDLRLSTGDRLFRGHGGLGVDVENVFDERNVINFQSGFSGTRFQIGRRVALSANFHY